MVQRVVKLCVVFIIAILFPGHFNAAACLAMADDDGLRQRAMMITGSTSDSEEGQTCNNMTEHRFELDFHMTEQDIRNLTYPDAYEWEVRYVDEMNNNTIRPLAYKWGRDYFEDGSLIEVSLRKLNNTEVVCIPRSQCVTFTISGLTATQFTARLEGTPIPISDYHTREYYIYGQNTSSTTFTTDLVVHDSEKNVCIPQCNEEEDEELFEMIIWGSEAGSSLDWVLLVVDGGEDKRGTSQLVTRCPKPEYITHSHTCGYRNNYLYTVRRCLDNKQGYRLALFNRYGNNLQDDPKREHPQIDVMFGGEHLESFGTFKAKSLAFGDGSDMCANGQLLELFAYQNSIGDTYPVENTAYQVSPRDEADNQSTSLNGKIENDDALHYAWKCVSLDACVDFTMHPDSTFPGKSYSVEILLQLDGEIYRETQENWRKDSVDIGETNRVESVNYPLIGKGCSYGPCKNATDVLMELELDIKPEVGPLTTRWDISLYSNEGERYIDDVVRGHQIMDEPLLENRTYRYYHCVPHDQCYKLRVLAYPDFNVTTTDMLLNSSMRVIVDGDLLINKHFPLQVDDDNVWSRTVIDLTGPCADDDLSKGGIVGAVIGSVIGFSGLMLGVLWYRRRQKIND